MAFLKITTVLAMCFSLVGTLPLRANENWTMASAKRAPDIGAEFDREFTEAITGATDQVASIEIQFVANEQEMVQQVLRGRLQLGVTSPLGLAAALPDIAVLNVPYLWLTQAERDFVYSRHLEEPLKEMFESKGLVLLSIQEAGYNGVFCKMDCSDPASLDGRKVRVSPSTSSRVFWESLNAIPVQLPLSDAWSALEQNLVIGGDLPIGFFSTTPGAATAKHFVFTNHTHSPWLYFANKRAWEQLDAEVQQAVLDAMPAMYSTSERFFADQEKRAEAYVQNGGKLYRLTDQEIEDWARFVTPNIDELVAGMGADAHAIYDAVKAGKAEFASRDNQ